MYYTEGQLGKAAGAEDFVLQTLPNAIRGSASSLYYLSMLELDEKYGVPTDMILVEEKRLYVCTFRGFLLEYDGTKSPLRLISERRVTKKPLRKILLLKDLNKILLSTPKGALFVFCLEGGSVEELACTDKEGETFSPGAITALAFGGGTLALGNEDGDLHLARVNYSSVEKKLFVSVAKTIDFHDDYISNLIVIPEKKTILCASGDGMMSVVDLKKEKVTAQSKNFDEDVTFILHIPVLSKVVLCTSGGHVKILKWNYWGSLCDSIKGRLHGNSSINDLMVLFVNDSPVLFSGDDEGIIRYFTPTSDTPKEWTRLADPIEKMILLPSVQLEDGSSLVACLCTENNLISTLKLNPSSLQISSKGTLGASKSGSDTGSDLSDSSDEEDEGNEEDGEDDGNARKKPKILRGKATKLVPSSSFFAGLD